MAGVPSGLRSGAESGGVSVGALEAARATKLLSRQLRGTELPRPSRTAPDAPPADTGLRILGTGGPLSVVSQTYAGRLKY